MNSTFLEILGYIASLTVLISLLMSSIVKLRWINLLGSAIFSTYGFLIGSLPVGFMNLCTCMINIYYLVKIYNSKEQFKILPLDGDSQYLKHFLDFYKSDISKFNGNYLVDKTKNNFNFFVLRDLVPAGIFSSSKYDESTLNISLDFVIPEYRDFKIGSFIYEENKNYFLNNGFKRFICFTSNNEQMQYLIKMGFKSTTENNQTCFEKLI